MATLNYNQPYQYNVNPTSTLGSGTAFGQVPGNVALPNPAADLGNQIPNLGALNSQIFGNLQSMAAGQIPQSDQNFLQDQAAAQAAAGGMPGSNVRPGTVYGNNSARNLGLLSYQLQQQAAQMYPSLTGSVSQTQTVSPQLQTQIAQQNAVNASAPNPAASQSYAQSLYNSYLNSARGGPGGGTAGRGAGGQSASDQWWNAPEPNLTNPAIGYGPGGGPGVASGVGTGIDPTPYMAGDNANYELTSADLGY